MKSVTLFAAIAAAAVLAACGGETPAAANHGDDALPNGMTVQQQIEVRPKNLKDLGAAMKTAGDQLKSSAPSLKDIRPAVQTIKTHAAEIGTWFPAGTGPESGVETEALSRIWEDQPGFQAAAQRLGEEANKLSDIATGDDLAAIGAQVGAVGAACKNCHDNYRQKKKD
jgi:cytochrome c556